jgi:hypothetical protein
MVLSGMGSVGASEANVHPLPVLVSMRLSDSLMIVNLIFCRNKALKTDYG